MSQLREDSPWNGVCDQIEADLPPHLQINAEYLIHTKNNQELLRLSWRNYPPEKADYPDLMKLMKKYGGTWIQQETTNGPQPAIDFPSTQITQPTPHSTPAYTPVDVNKQVTIQTPTPHRAEPIPQPLLTIAPPPDVAPAKPGPSDASKSKEQPSSPRKHFNLKYCAACDERGLCAEETIHLCVGILQLQAQEAQAEALQKWANRPTRYPKKDPPTERHILDGISWMSCEGKNGPYEKALEKENVPNDMYVTWKQMVKDAATANKKGAIIKGTLADPKTQTEKPLEYWCWLNDYEGEISLCRKPAKTDWK
jgi:hypothetical protein